MIQEKNKTEKILLFFITAGFYLIFLLPLIFSQEFYFPFVSLKNFTFRIIVEIQFLLWSILIIKNKKYLPQISWPLLSILFLALVIFFANWQGIGPQKSYWGNLERMDGMVNLLHLLFYFMIAATVLKTRKQWRFLAIYSLSVATVLGGIGFYELSLDPHKLLTSTLGNSAYFAIYLIFHLFLAGIFSLYTYKKSKKLFFVYLFLIIYFLLLLYNTGSRGTFLGGGIGTALTLLILGWQESKKILIKKIVAWCLLGLVIVGGGLWSLKETSFVKNSHTLSRLTDASSTSAVRFRFWNMAIEAIKERPLLGWGQESFDTVFEHYYDTRQGDDTSWYDRPHNTILEWTVSGGLLGGVAYLGLFVCALFWLWRKNNIISEDEISFEEKALLSGLLIAYLVHNLFMFDYLASYFLFFSFLAYVSKANRHEMRQTPKIQQTLVFLMAFGIVFYLGYNFFIINLPGLGAARDINAALKLHQFKENAAAFEKIKEVVERKSFLTNEALEKLGQIAIAVHYDQNINKNLKSEYIDYALTKLAASANEEPKTLRKSYIYLVLAAQQDDRDLESLFVSVLKISPKRQAVYLVMINYYLRKNEFSKAQELAKKNYELDTTIHNSKAIYALCALLNKNLELSDKLLFDVPIKYYVEMDIFIHAYSALGRMDKVVDFYKKKIEHAPLDPNNHTKLGMVYKELGKSEEALREFDQARKIVQDNF